MEKWRRVARLTVVIPLAWATLAWVTGCSRQFAVPGSGATADSGHLPFDRVKDNGGISPTAEIAPEGIPARTEIIIRLQSELSSTNCRAGDSFQAVLDEPVVVAGKTMVPRGTAFTGSVVAAKASGGAHTPGYLRVTLVSIAMKGRSVPLETSSIFAKGGSHERRTATMKRSVGDGGNETDPSPIPTHGDVKFSTGRRLSFRVNQPLHPLG